MKPTLRHLLLVCAVLATGGSLRAAEPSAQEILAATDQIRNPSKPFSVTLTLSEFHGKEMVDSSTMTAYSRTNAATGQFGNLVAFVLPARDAGKLMLKNGNDLWFFDPANKASVRLSPQQRLLGQASNGDVMTVNLARDYKASLAGTEEITDGERKTRQAYHLNLAATTNDVTYPSIEMWVDMETKRPIKAKFYADSGRLLKIAIYRKFQMQLGVERPTETVIIDGLDSKQVTLMRYTDYAWRNIPESWMQRDYLPRFQPE